MSTATATACANIALAKYWGKSDLRANLPAVPSLSLTLAALRTTTTVTFDASLAGDIVFLDGKQQSDTPRARVTAMLDRIREETNEQRRARVESSNDFPTAAGLASSASGFAALAVAALAAAEGDTSPAHASDLARQSSASAGRSIFGGYVELEASGRCAKPVAAGDWLDAKMVIALTETGPKAIGSTEGMLHTAKTSPYYAAWVDDAPRIFARARAALLDKDFETLGAAMEQSTLMMHASMLAADPGVLYLAPASTGAIRCVRALRDDGVGAYFTMDAGPHVKVLARSADVDRVSTALHDVTGVTQVVVSDPGDDARLCPDESPQ